MGIIKDKLKDIITNNAPYASNKEEAKVISICSQKGGVGKTTTAVNMAVALSRFYMKRVLLVDLDPQGHVQTSLQKLVPDGQEYELLSSVVTSKRGNLLNAVVETNIKDFHMTPGDKNLVETEMVLNGRIGKEFILRDAIKPASRFYNYIILDCPPHLGNLTVNALVSSDYAIIPCEMSLLALEGVSDLCDTIETIQERLNPDLEIMGILLTRVDGRNILLNAEVRAEISRYFGSNIFETIISVNNALNRAQLSGEPIFDFDSSSTGARNYKNFTREILARLKDEFQEERQSA